MNYYPRYPAHYQAKTLHLTMEQDGAYTRLLDWYYGNERPVPHAMRYTIARAMTASEKRSVDAVLSEFFSQENGLWINARASAEVELAQPKIAAARENGKKGGRPKKNNELPCPAPGDGKPIGLSNENPVGFQNETQTEPSAKAPQSPREKQKQKHENPDGFSSPEPVAPVATGNPAAGSGDLPVVPNCPVQRIVDAYHAELPMLPRVRALPDAAERMLRTRWREDQSRQTVEWWREFFVYVRGCPFLVGAKTDFTADLLWIVRPVNFAKIVNGNFEEKTA